MNLLYKEQNLSRLKKQLRLKEHNLSWLNKQLLGMGAEP